jgi:hypothetical protein
MDRSLDPPFIIVFWEVASSFLTGGADPTVKDADADLRCEVE